MWGDKSPLRKGLAGERGGNRKRGSPPLGGGWGKGGGKKGKAPLRKNWADKKRREHKRKTILGVTEEIFS